MSSEDFIPRPLNVRLIRPVGKKCNSNIHLDDEFIVVDFGELNQTGSFNKNHKLKLPDANEYPVGHVIEIKTKGLFTHDGSNPVADHKLYLESEEQFDDFNDLVSFSHTGDKDKNFCIKLIVVKFKDICARTKKNFKEDPCDVYYQHKYCICAHETYEPDAEEEFIC